MAERSAGDPLRLSQTEPVPVQDLQPGARLRLVGDVTAEVVSNPRDGLWVVVRYLSVPENPGLVGAEEMVFANDILEQLRTTD